MTMPDDSRSRAHRTRRGPILFVCIGVVLASVGLWVWLQDPGSHAVIGDRKPHPPSRADTADSGPKALDPTSDPIRGTTDVSEDSQGRVAVLVTAKDVELLALRGRVVFASTKQGAAGVRVALWEVKRKDASGKIVRRPAPELREPDHSVVADTKGGFTFQVSAGQYCLLASMAGVRSSYWPIVIEASVTPPAQTLLLWPVLALEGVCVDEKGVPVAGASVSCRRSYTAPGLGNPSESHLGQFPCVITDSDGVYRLNIEKRGVYRLQAQRRVGTLQQSTEVLHARIDQAVPGREHWILRFPVSATIAGKVLGCGDASVSVRIREVSQGSGRPLRNANHQLKKVDAVGNYGFLVKSGIVYRVEVWIRGVQDLPFKNLDCPASQTIRCDFDITDRVEVLVSPRIHGKLLADLTSVLVEVQIVEGTTSEPQARARRGTAGVPGSDGIRFPWLLEGMTYVVKLRNRSYGVEDRPVEKTFVAAKGKPVWIDLPSDQLDSMYSIDVEIEDAGKFLEGESQATLWHLAKGSWSRLRGFHLGLETSRWKITGLQPDHVYKVEVRGIWLRIRSSVPFAKSPGATPPKILIRPNTKFFVRFLATNLRDGPCYFEFTKDGRPVEGLGTMILPAKSRAHEVKVPLPDGRYLVLFRDKNGNKIEEHSCLSLLTHGRVQTVTIER